ncbi:MAG: hypothetical protein HY782_11380 [Chloroflexi bacterium]|nr:hypothetical protein [Chloroflexota bacterium]
MTELGPRALPVAILLLIVLVVVFGWLAASVATDWIKIAAATHTPTITITPSPTPTFSPTFTPTLTPTLSPTPTTTPTATSTPTLIPTYTPYPTFTPFPTATPIPCNPARRDPATIRANLADSPDQARGIVENVIRRWTRVETLPRVGSPSVRFYLTYLSPQVIEAIALDRSVRERVPAEKRPELLIEYDRQLYARNAFPFILTLRGPSDRSLLVKFSPLNESMTIVNQNRQAIAATSQYAPLFTTPLDFERGGGVGYVLFPRAIGTGCNPTINLAIDRSFDVRLWGLTLYGFLSLPFTSNDQVTWSFELLPDTSLEQTLKIPPPRQVPEIDSNTLAEISGLAFNLFESVLR